MKYKGTELLLIYAAFASIYIFWGSTYLAVKIAVQSIPPFLMGSIRFVIAGLLLLIAGHLFWKTPLPSKKQFGNAALVGTLFLGVGTGSVAWALQYVDSGIVALIISAQPLLTIFLVWIMLKNPPPISSYLGIFLGMLGMYLLVTQNYVTSKENSWWGIMAVVLGMFAWGYSSVYVKKADMPKGQAQNAALQMLAGSLSLLIFSFFVGDYKGFELSNVNQTTVLAILFLIFFGSIIGFSSFNYLLKRISPEKVSTSTYVNPIVAMFLGWWIGGEIITLQSIIAALIMLTGVLFINIDMLKILKKARNRRSLVKAS